MYVTNNKSATSPEGPVTTPVNSIKCEAVERTNVHYHAHLDMYYNGAPFNLPANIGIKLDCLYWLHTHDVSGIVHIEAPADQKDRVFTLGDLFDVWKQPLNEHQLATLKTKDGERISAWIDGQPYSGELRKLPMKEHSEIVLAITPPEVDPPKTYSWPQGL